MIEVLEFIVARYNYWIVIILMMTGLYTVIARGNLVKKVIGLNVFQTSVFIFYITIGKITGGTAPIYTADDWSARTDHGDGHGGGHGDGHAPEAAHSGASAHGSEVSHTEDVAHATEHGDVSESLHGGGESSNTLGTSASDTNAGHALAGGHSTEAPANDVLHDNAPLTHAKEQVEGVGGHLGEAVSSIDVIYSNPLPHVLILTAIVVGVATTAVGLALAVRIREAYGTIEEDELEALDNIAEFGEPTPTARAAS